MFFNCKAVTVAGTDATFLLRHFPLPVGLSGITAALTTESAKENAGASWARDIAVDIAETLTGAGAIGIYNFGIGDVDVKLRGTEVDTPNVVKVLSLLPASGLIFTLLSAFIAPDS